MIVNCLKSLKKAISVIQHIFNLLSFFSINWLKKIKLDYDWSYFLPPKQDYTVHKGSCLTHQTKELTDIHEEYGLGETYTFDNTVIQQLWYTNKE